MSYKSSNFRRGQNSTPANPEKSNSAIVQLQELFPAWSEDDLKSTLQEANGDVDLAAARISEGHAEQWGSVHRKKEKRAPAGVAQTRDSTGTARERVDSRGGRGGRGASRGGRGGGRGGHARGGHRELNGRSTTSPKPGDAHQQANSASTWADATTATGAEGSNANEAAGGPTSTPEAWGKPAGSGDAWGGVEHGASAASTAESPVAAIATSSTTAHPEETKAQSHQTNGWEKPEATSAQKVVKTPATTKLSWAQIARPQEKPKPAPPAPTLAPPTAAPVPAQAPAPVSVPTPAAIAPPPPTDVHTVVTETQPESSSAQGWEDPTTAQAPTWDDEPQVQPQTSLPVTSDGWITSKDGSVTSASGSAAVPVTAIPAPTTKEESAPPVAPVPVLAKTEPSPATAPAPEPLPSPFPVQLQQAQKAESTSLSVGAAPVVMAPVSVKPSTPVGQHRPHSAHRVSSRFKTSDQAVVMPISSYAASVERIGMQFGSVSLGGDDAFDSLPEPPVPEPVSQPSEAVVPSAQVAPAAEQQQQQPQRQPSPEVPMQETKPSPAVAPAPVAASPILPAQVQQTQTSSSAQNLFQQAASLQQQQPQIAAASPAQTQTQPTGGAPGLVPQTVVSSQPSLSSQASTVSSSPLPSFTQQTTPSTQSPYQTHSQQVQTPAQVQAQAQPTQVHTPVQVQAQAQVQSQSQQQQPLHQFSHHGFQSHAESGLQSSQQQVAQSQQQAVQQQPQQPTQQPQTQPQPVQPQPATAATLAGVTGSSYFRQPEQSYFHAPTPPAVPAQENLYGSFGPLSGGLQHQGQGSHLSGFDHFQYNEAPRGFYDTYAQQTGFGGRATLGHDDVSKSIPSQQPAPSSLPQSGAISTSTPQTSSQPQSATQPQPQAPTNQPQQGYAPLPYYYNPYQAGVSGFYGPPYGSGYGMSQYGAHTAHTHSHSASRFQPPQQAMFQPGPNPGTASPATGKGPNAPQSNPYAQGLYGHGVGVGMGQQVSSGYDDSAYHGQHGQSVGVGAGMGVAGLPTSDYGKQLYGGHGQGIPGFMGSGQSAGVGGNAQLGQRGGVQSTTSPENAYKGYGPGVGVGSKDVGQGVGGGVGSGVSGVSSQSGLGQTPQGRGVGVAGVQQPHHQQHHQQHQQHQHPAQGSFYGANRFGANPAAGSGGQPGQGVGVGVGQHGQLQHGQAGQGYQQGADNSFYYARGQSTQYWQ